MQQSDVVRMLASRPSGAALASLFSDHSEAPVVQSRPPRGPAPVMRAVGRGIAQRARDLFLSQVPCEDFVFGTVAAHFIRRRTQM